MSGDLVISGGGSTEVATASLLSQQQHLREIANELQRCLRQLQVADAMVSRARLRAADAPLSSMDAERCMREANDCLHAAFTHAQTLADALRTAAQAYGGVEAAADRWARELSGTIAYQLGFWGPLVGALTFPVLAPLALAAGGALALGWLITPEATREHTIHEWMQDNKAVLSDPRFVDFVRLAVSSSDDFGEGLVHFPAALGELLGDGGLGILGVGSSASVVVGAAAMAGALRETPVRTAVTSTSTGARPPTGLADRADRIPTGEDQIRIDRYPQPGGAPDRFEVYLGGTIDGSLVAGSEPWDMTSNLHGVAGDRAGSLAAARQAMAQAGIDGATPVTFTGYSQGGLLSAELAASGDFDTRGLVTFGGPCGGVSVPHDIPYVAVEHADDLVPATGGVWKSSDPLLVTRTAVDGSYSGNAMLPAHELSNYRETASLADASDERSLSAARDRLRDFAAGSVSGETSYFHATRIER